MLHVMQITLDRASVLVNKVSTIMPLLPSLVMGVTIIRCLSFCNSPCQVCLSVTLFSTGHLFFKPEVSAPLKTKAVSEELKSAMPLYFTQSKCQSLYSDPEDLDDLANPHHHQLWLISSSCLSFSCLSTSLHAFLQTGHTYSCFSTHVPLTVPSVWNILHLYIHLVNSLTSSKALLKS